jgi:hypothetical protein
MLLMRFPAEVTIVAASINDRLLEMSEDDQPGKGPWLFRYNAAPLEGIDVEFELAGPSPFTCWFGDRSLGLPALPGKTYPPRSAAMMPVYGSDVVLLGRQYAF